MGGSTAAVVVLITAPPDAAQAIARSILEAKLAACATIVPRLHSLYWWEGALRQDEEALLLVKTRQAAVPALTDHVRALHPYDNPEVVALPITGGSAEYLAWIAESVEAAGEAGER